MSISDFDEHPEFFMTESGTFEGYGAGKIEGKIGSDDQTPEELFKHSTSNPSDKLAGAKVLP